MTPGKEEIRIVLNVARFQRTKRPKLKRRRNRHLKMTKLRENVVDVVLALAEMLVRKKYQKLDGHDDRRPDVAKPICHHTLSIPVPMRTTNSRRNKRLNASEVVMIQTVVRM